MPKDTTMETTMDDGDAHDLPRVEGERVVLRQWRAQDREHLSFDDAITGFVGPSLPPNDTEGFAKWLDAQEQRRAQGTALTWCVADPQTDAPLGWISLFAMNTPYQHGTADIGYWMLPAGRGTGAALEALEMLTEAAFADGRLGIHRIHAATDHRNVASQRLLRRAGFTATGIERYATVYEPGGEQFNAVRFERLASELRPVTDLKILDDGVVRLRSWRRADAQRVMEACRDESTRQWLPLPDPYTLVDAEEYIANCQQFPIAERWALCVADAQTDGCIGALDVRLNTPPQYVGSGEIGYWTHPDARGRGTMTAALKLVQRHAFTPVDQGGGGLRRLSLQAAGQNAASRRVAIKAGFTEVGVDRKAWKLPDGSFVDHIRFDMLAEEFTD